MSESIAEAISGAYESIAGNSDYSGMAQAVQKGVKRFTPKVNYPITPELFNLSSDVNAPTSAQSVLNKYGPVIGLAAKLAQALVYNATKPVDEYDEGLKGVDILKYVPDKELSKAIGESLIGGNVSKSLISKLSRLDVGKDIAQKAEKSVLAGAKSSTKSWDEFYNSLGPEAQKNWFITKLLSAYNTEKQGVKLLPPGGGN